MSYFEYLKRTVFHVCVCIISKNCFYVLFTYFNVETTKPIGMPGWYELVGSTVGIVGGSFLFYRLEKRWPQDEWSPFDENS